jgi:hypothetical protein
MEEDLSVRKPKNWLKDRGTGHLQDRKKVSAQGFTGYEELKPTC